MGESCGCCRVCCYSTPYGTIFALSVTVVGLVGFLSSAVYSVALVNATPYLTNHTIILAPIIGGVAGTTIFPLILVTILAYCVTGYVRDELYHPFVKTCVGPVCNVLVILLTFIFFLLWLVLSVALSIVMAIYIQVAWLCPQVDFASRLSLGNGYDWCSDFGSGDDNEIEVCVRGLGSLCEEDLSIGLALAISLGFSLLVVVGFVLIMIVQSANIISVRESNKRSYRPGGSY